MDTCNNCGGYTTSDPYLTNMLDSYPCECENFETKYAGCLIPGTNEYDIDDMDLIDLEEEIQARSAKRDRSRKTPMVVDGAGIKAVELNRHYKRPRKGRKEEKHDT